MTSEESKETAAEEWNRLSDLVRSLPKITSYSVAKRIAVSLLGPSVRIWRKSNIIQIGFDKNGQRHLLGEGPGYTDAIRLVAFTLAQIKAKEIGDKTRDIGDDKKDKEGVQSNVGGGEESKQAGPIEGGGDAQIASGGMVQETSKEEVNVIGHIAARRTWKDVGQE